MRGLTNWTVALAVLLLLAFPVWAGAQQEEETQDPPAEEESLLLDNEEGEVDLLLEDEGAQEGDALDETFGEEPEDELEAIDDLLEGEIEVLETGFTYDDGGRRDPFHSLLDITREAPREDARPRPPGIAGLSIDEISVTGVWIYPDGPVAQVQAANKAKSFLIRPGDQLWDGDVLRINYVRYDGSEVVFKQIVDDPTATKPFREVVRRIEQ